MSGTSETILIVCFAVLARWCVSLNSYSGEGKPPMFGDYEAQRHWMEITYNLPAQQWYVNGTANDLLYWGLDYPPLTAYHSWVMGAVASRVNGSWVSLFTSRGTTSLQHKLFMRATALVADVLVYFPAIYTYFRLQTSLDKTQQLLSWMVVLLYPGLNLIDHGHFQYNSVSLGLAAWAVIGLSSGHDLLGAVAFVLALNYKQMELYHALPFFCYLLGACFKGPENWLLKLLKLGVVVLATFALCWLPFLQSQSLTLQVLHRLFPFARGLFEDKVANIWCSLSLLIKLKNIFTQEALIKICLGSTLICLLPSSLHLLLKPSLGRFKLAMINASLVFFLFSYQVHEKSILIVAMPVCLLLPWRPLMCMWFLLISTFSMVPLLLKDGLLVAYGGSTLLFTSLAFMVLPQDTAGSPTQSATAAGKGSLVVKVLFMLSQLGCLVLVIASVALKPPSHLPDLFPVLVSAYAAGHFLLFLLYFHWLQFTWTDPLPASATASPVKLANKTNLDVISSKPSKQTYSPKAKSVKKKKLKNQ